MGLFLRLTNLFFPLYKFLFLPLRKGLFLLKLEQMSENAEFPALLCAILDDSHRQGKSLESSTSKEVEKCSVIL